MARGPVAAKPPYGGIAGVYDRWMAADRIPYEEWFAFTSRRFAEAGREVRSVVDICCGTGVTVRRLQEQGFGVTGVDASPEMLDIARRRAAPGTELVELVLPDERLARLGRFDAALMCFDGANYLTGEDALARTLGHIATALEPGGVVVFDLSTRLSFEAIAAMGGFGERFDDFGYTWDTRHEPGSAHYEYLVTLTDPDGREVARERHQQRWFDRDEVEAALTAAGFTGVAVHDNYGEQAAGPRTRRDTWSARLP
ncbi:class I SAM-dependent DNA methyltransferase [Saccharothrix lopnurensis]|uniref:Class I SAM-dependent DNA methyltransferase n=1 Tax=Saccharothrix lopnurensis TaxID=1670621 RepID=A0ABW1PBJ9_9PSEU